VDAAAIHALVEDIFAVTPEDSFDHHLLIKLASFLNAEISVIPNPINPQAQKSLLVSTTLLERTSPFSKAPYHVVSSSSQDVALAGVTTRATSNVPRLLIFTETQRRILRLDLDSYNL
jgi:hypothetical protein